MRTTIIRAQILYLSPSIRGTILVLSTILVWGLLGETARSQDILADYVQFSFAELQGADLALEESAVGIFGTAFSNTDADGYAFQPSASYHGMLDLSLRLSKARIDTSATDVTSMGGALAIHVLKQTEQRFLGIAVYGRLLHDSYSDDDLESKNLEMIGNTYSGGIVLYKTMRPTHSIDVILLNGVSATQSNVTLRARSTGAKATGGDNEVAISLGVALVTRIAKAWKLSVYPSASISDAATTLGVTAGFVMVHI